MHRQTVCYICKQFAILAETQTVRSHANSLLTGHLRLCCDGAFVVDLLPMMRLLEDELSDV